jgi:DNA polymerase III epsilon subunit-like protein
MNEGIPYVSVDIETAGPIPNRFSMLSLGACLVADPSHSMYLEFKPKTMDYVPSALAISQLSMERLASDGQPIADGLRQFAEWLEAQLPDGQAPTFVAFNAPFDWSFVNYEFHQNLGYNPFGHAALDIKAYAMGVLNLGWKETSFSILAQQFIDQPQLSHHALKDAQDQALVFRQLLERQGQGSQ